MSISYAFSDEEYISYPELTKLVQGLHMTTKPDYVKFFRENGKELDLPPFNQIPRIYSENWGSWYEFFGLSEKEYNKHIQDLSNSDQPSKQNFSTVDETIEQITAQLDEEGIAQPKPQKPSESIKTPTKEHPNYRTPKKKEIKINKGIRNFLTYEEAKARTQELGIPSGRVYKKRYSEIDGAPSNPDRTYRKEWKGWRDFHGTQISRPTYKELKEGVQRLNFQSRVEYQERRKEIHPGAPAHPETFYPDEWEGWGIFFNIQISRPTYKELKEGAQRLNFKSMKEYREGREKIHPGAPANPDRFYAEWEGAVIFLNKSKCEQVLNQ